MIMIKCVYPKLIQACFIGQVDDGFSYRRRQMMT